MRACHEAFIKHIGTGHYRSVLVLNGELPDKEFFYTNLLPVIAADGAVNALNAVGIKPQAVVGDLDSANPALLTDLEVVYEPDQNSCDFEKAIAYAGEKNLLPTIVVGMSGGYIGHILNNIHVFLKNESIFYAPPIVGHLVKEGEERSFSLPINTKISLFGMPSAEVSSMGLKWELENANLALLGDTSAFNRIKQEKVLIKVHKGLVLVLVYLAPINDCGSRP